MHYNLTALTNMCGGDPQFMRDLIQLFVDTTPPCITQINEFRKEENWKEIGDILHRIKPTIELFGMERIIVEIKSAEQMARNGEDLDKLKPLLDYILPELEIAIEAVKSEIPNYT